jgi:ABC-type iron transport system FetAB ATPase subunit
LGQLSIEDLYCHDLGPLTLAVESGQCMGLTGPSGAGKSLLLRAIADLDPHRGCVFLDGQACDQMSGPQWRRRVGLLPAENQWWHTTVGAHFPQLDEARVQAIGFTSEVMKWEVERLSSGERQRLALLRLLARCPQVLLLDEPTANLDKDNSAKVEALVTHYQLTYRAPVLWVSHDLDQLKRVASRLMSLCEGRLDPFIP